MKPNGKGCNVAQECAGTEGEMVMSEIKIETITASNAGGEKSEVYRLLNMVHVMAGRCAVAKTDGWSLSETCTTHDYVKTVWTNGVVDVIAETWPDEGEHRYELRQCMGEK